MHELDAKTTRDKTKPSSLIHHQLLLGSHGNTFFVILLETLRVVRRMAIPERLNVIFKRPLVLEVGSASAVPELATVLLVCPPITLHCKGFTAGFSADKGFGSMLSLVVSLKGSEVLEGLRLWVVYVVLAAYGAAVAGQS